MNLENKLWRGFKKAILPLLVASVFYSCPLPTDSKKIENSSKVQVPETVNIFSEKDSNKISYLSDNIIEFSQPVDYSINDIVVSGVTINTPNGLLRKVSGISPDRKKVLTTQATIPELAKDYSAHFSKRLSPNEARSVSLSRGVIANPRTIDLFDFNYDLDKNIDLDGNPYTIYDKVNIKGNISLNSNIDFNWAIDDEFRLKQFEFKNTTSNEIDITIDALENLSNLSKTIEIAKYNFPPITFATPTTPPIPIVINPVLDINLELSGGVTPVSLNLNQNANLVLGLNYYGEWSPIKEFSNSFNSQFSEIPSLELLVNPKQRLTANFYGIAGPYAEANEYLKFLFNPSGWEILGGISGKAGVKMELFGENIADYNKILFTSEKILKEGNFGSGNTPSNLGKIIFFSGRYPSGLYTMNSDGSSQQILIEGNVMMAKWNKTRDKFVYVQDMGMNSIPIQDPEARYEIWTANSDGSNRIRLTNNQSYDHSPQISPDGGKIVFVSGRDGYFRRLYIMNFDGTNQEKLTNQNALEDDPSFSPDGKNVIYLSYSSGIKSVDLSTREINLLTSTKGGYPIQSSSGKLFFIPLNYKEICSMDLNTYEIQQVLKTGGGILDLTLKEDESKLLFSSNPTGNYEIYSSSLEGKNLVNLTNNPNLDRQAN